MRTKIFKKSISIILTMTISASMMSVSAAAEQINDNCDIISELMNYAIFSESEADNIILNAETNSINGEIYSNYNVHEDKILYMANFSENFMSFDNTTYTTTENSTLVGTTLNENTFGTQKLNVDCDILYIDEILGANESVDISCENVTGINNSDTVIFSSNGDVTIKADSVDFNGIIYAPNGKITIGADHININGSIIGSCVEINSDSCTIKCNEELINKYHIDTYNVNDIETDNYELNNLDDTVSPCSASASEYYYNTGTGVVAQATYSKYRLLSVVKKGDIIHEKVEDSYLGKITDHIAYVEGVYYLPKYGSGSSSSTYISNIRVIEALSAHDVCRGILDDQRCIANGVKLLRYKTDLPSNVIAQITYFISRQIGKDYSMAPHRNTSIDSEEWYCSELVWAGYNYCGYDIEDGDLGYITPGDILDSKNTRIISYK